MGRGRGIIVYQLACYPQLTQDEHSVMHSPAQHEGHPTQHTTVQHGPAEQVGTIWMAMCMPDLGP